MRTAHDDLRSSLTSILLSELDSGDLTEDVARRLYLRTADAVMEEVWSYLEEYKIDSNGNFIFEYGMLKHLLKGGE